MYIDEKFNLKLIVKLPVDAGDLTQYVFFLN